MALLLFFASSLWAANNVILFIGDGMGPSVVSATRIQYGKLGWDDFPHSAFVMTKSADNHVTDSAAAATAMASGVKTDNDVLGLGPKDASGKRQSLSSLTDIAKNKKYSTGLVTTTTVTHATPAAFYAHNANRDDDANIAMDLFNSNLDVVYGGSTFGIQEQLEKNKDRYHVVREKKDLPTKITKPILGIFHPDNLPYYDSKEFDSSIHPRLEEMTLNAIDLLMKNKKGFFLMVEGGRIDHALHKNDIPKALVETSEFSRTVAATMKKLKQEGLLKNTLVIVTADHDTAGLSINGYLKVDKPLIIDRTIASSEEDSVLVLTTVKAVKKSSAAHTAVDVPLYATGVCSQKFAGLIDNTDIFKKIKECL
jgi:alkaline phosphatase